MGVSDKHWSSKEAPPYRRKSVNFLRSVILRFVLSQRLSTILIAILMSAVLLINTSNLNGLFRIDREDTMLDGRITARSGALNMSDSAEEVKAGGFNMSDSLGEAKEEGMDMPSSAESEAQEDDEKEETTPQRGNPDLYNDLSVGDCVPMHPWQTMQYPSCNLLHELTSPPDLSYINHGSMNLVLGVNQDALPLESHRFVLKTLVYKSSFSHGHYEEKRMEGVVLEHLTWSPYIPPIYGFCGMSTVAPFAAGGTLFDVVDSSRRGGNELAPIDKLRIGIQVAQGLASLHGIDQRDGTRPSFAHNDLDVSQYTFHDGIFQLNDFNYGKFLLHDPKKNNTPCKSTSGMTGWKYRAPEDLENIYKKHRKPFVVDKADVYSMCNALYMVLTNLWLWEGERRHASAKRVMSGERPPIPEIFSNNTNKAHQAMIKAMNMCYRRKPRERATALKVAKFLTEELCRLDERDGGCVGDGPVRVQLPPLLDRTWDDDDYDVNMR